MRKAFDDEQRHLYSFYKKYIGDQKITNCVKLVNFQKCILNHESCCDNCNHYSETIFRHTFTIFTKKVSGHIASPDRLVLGRTEQGYKIKVSSGQVSSSPQLTQAGLR